MPEFVADFHIHSRYSRACSKDLSVSELSRWAKIKGIGLLGTGDFTHPLWMQELKDNLRGLEGGLYESDGTRFVLTAEVDTLFYRSGKAHNIHSVLFVPSIESADRVNNELSQFGSLEIDGRPILRMEPWRLVETVLGVEPRALVVPAHAWTPHFSIFGSNSGFDSVEEAFEHQAKNIFALETGLSSDPAMNWRLSKLDRYTLLSNSDSHSARRIGREANMFDCRLDYDEIIDAIKKKDPARIKRTIEFFPEEGKYHYDGHRNCKVCWSPAESKKNGLRCSVCGRKVTVGVMNRVDSLADRPEGSKPSNTIPFTSIVPLEEVISDSIGVGVGSQAVEREYMGLVSKCGSEFDAMLRAPEEKIRESTSSKIAEGIIRMRQGKVRVSPGYDGEYGKISLFGEESIKETEQQMKLF
jgi:uncharacterized protein (TIGR00375 family)